MSPSPHKRGSNLRFAGHTKPNGQNEQKKTAKSLKKGVNNADIDI